MNSVWENSFTVLTLTLFAGGITFWVLALHRWYNGETVVPNRFRHADVSVPPAALVIAGVWMAWVLFERYTPAPEIPFDPDRVLQGIPYLVLIGATFTSILLFTIAVSVESPIELFKLGFRCDAPAEQIREGAVGFVAGLLPVTLVMLASSSLRTEDSTHSLLRVLLDQGITPETASIAVLAVVIAPLQEELAFRVILQSWLRSLIGAPLAIIVASALFAAVHDFPDSLALFPLALILGVLFERRRSYIAAVTMHALFNAFNLLGAVLQSTLEAVPGN